MTEVLSIQRHENVSPFGSPLRRSSSQTSLFLQRSASFSHSTPNCITVRDENPRQPNSLPSSAPSSPRLAPLEFSNGPSFTSTPSSSFSLDDHCSEENDICFTSYNDGAGLYQHTIEENILQTSLSRLEDSTLASVEESASKNIFGGLEPLHPPYRQSAGDDTAIESEPTRHVDYLSHAWKEEDIWSSWRYVVSRRKFYSNWPRLENASWRSWVKTKNQLGTVPPERLNWMKDHDVTWLYGPLQISDREPIALNPTPPASQISRSNSLISKKPILKKRSPSEIMLQRSLSSSTLMKQATDALRAQHRGHVLDDVPSLDQSRLSSFVLASKNDWSNHGANALSSSTATSTSTSGLQTPCTRRHIHFNNKVEQCIIINKDADRSSRRDFAIEDEETSSDEEFLVMKPVENKTKIKIRSIPSTPRNSFSNESRTIAKLPSTTLKTKEDTPEPLERKFRAKEQWPGTSKLSPSPSQQTLRPSSPSQNFLLDDEDEDADMHWQPAAPRRSSLYPCGGINSAYDYDEDDDNEAEQIGMRRTSSGMFMPDEDDEDVNDGGIFGKVVDTVNTAKDIAHVIWNVGWYR